MIKRNLFVSIATVIILLFGGNSAFGQCGADGTQPCPKATPKKPTTTKKPTTKKTTTTKPTVTKPTTTNKTQSSKTKKNTSNVSNPLKNKLIGTWGKPYSSNVFWTFFANGTGNFGFGETACQKFRFVLTGDVLRITPTWIDKDSNCDDKVEIYQIEFDTDGNLLVRFQKRNKTYDDSETFTKVK